MKLTKSFIIAVIAGLIILFQLEQKNKFSMSLFKTHGLHFNVPPNLLAAIAKKESNFNPNAVAVNKNGSKDFGIMQINDTNFDVLNLSKTNALDPSKNIEAASKLLSMLRSELGSSFNLFNWISSYNQGSPKTLREGIKNPLYVAEVYYYYLIYKL